MRIRVYSVIGNDLGLRRPNWVARLIKHQRAEWQEQDISIRLLFKTNEEILEEEADKLLLLAAGRAEKAIDPFYNYDMRVGEWKRIQGKPLGNPFTRWQFRLGDVHLEDSVSA